MRSFSFILITILSSFVQAAPATPDGTEDEIKAIVSEACGSSRVEELLKPLSNQIKRIGKKDRWQTSLRASIYTSCFLQYSEWRLMLSFNLGHVGIVDKLRPGTIVFLTSLLSKNAMGKDAYVDLGKMFEMLEDTGLDRELVKDVITTGRESDYRINALEGLAIIYIEKRMKGKSHEAALKEAIEDGKKIRNTTNRGPLLKKTAEILKETGTLAVEPVLDKTYWAAHKNVISAEKSPNLKTLPLSSSKLSAAVAGYEKARFRTGGNTRTEADDAGFVLGVVADLGIRDFPAAISTIAAAGEEADLNSLQPGDILLFSLAADRKTLTHVGIALSRKQFAYMSSEGLIRSDLNDLYRAHLRKARRIFEPQP